VSPHKVCGRVSGGSDAGAEPHRRAVGEIKAFPEHDASGDAQACGALSGTYFDRLRRRGLPPATRDKLRLGGLDGFRRVAPQRLSEQLRCASLPLLLTRSGRSEQTMVGVDHQMHGHPRGFDQSTQRGVVLSAKAAGQSNEDSRCYIRVGGERAALPPGDRGLRDAGQVGNRTLLDAAQSTEPPQAVAEVRDRGSRRHKRLLSSPGAAAAPAAPAGRSG
jgi:hypothetical protein